MRYQIRHALVQYGADTILEDVNFEIRNNEKIALTGRNGCGKTTLLKLINGDIHMNNLDSDEECGITMAGKQQIGFLHQISFPDGEISVEEEIRKVFAPIFACEARMKEIEEQLQSGQDKALMHEYDSLQKQMEALRGYTWRQDMEIMFQSFGFALADLERPIGSFSGGQQTKVAFIKLLLSRPDIMLLDEPTNHLDLPTIEWLEGYLKKYDKSVVIVSHDRMFLDRVIDVTYEIEYHRIKRYPGNYTAFLAQKEAALEKQEKDYEAQQKEIQRLTEWIEKWKNTPSKVAATRSKRMVIEHMVKIEKPRRFDTRAFHALFEPRLESYTEVINVKNLRIGYDTELARLSFTLRRGERLAVIGENGIGKSTLLKTLTGLVKPLGGSFSFGANVEWGYFDQQAAVSGYVEPEQTVLDNFWDEYPRLQREQVRSALGSFLFSQEEVEKKMGQLSGGERVRLALCKMFQTRPNLLILDEPTNHMDIVGKETLEQMLAAFSGTVLFVSHDRYFIRQIATGVLEFEENDVVQYPYAYEDYLHEKEKRLARLGGVGGSGSRSASGKAGSGAGGAGSKGGIGVGSSAGSKGGIGVGGGNGAAGGSGSGKDAGRNGDASQPGSGRPAENTGSGGSKGTPTLSDIFDKKTYYSPGKIKSRLTRQQEKYEKQLSQSEERTAELKLQMMDPALASDYEKLMELQTQLDEEEQNQESLLERLVETETALQELGA